MLDYCQGSSAIYPGYDRFGEPRQPGDRLTYSSRCPQRGEMTAMPQLHDPTIGLNCIYDAWNRLVQVSQGMTVLAQYEYDGLNRRIVRTEGGVTVHCYSRTFHRKVKVRNVSASSSRRQSGRGSFRDRGGHFAGGGGQQAGTTSQAWPLAGSGS